MFCLLEEDFILEYRNTKLREKKSGGCHFPEEELKSCCGKANSSSRRERPAMSQDLCRGWRFVHPKITPSPYLAPLCQISTYLWFIIESEP